jgi:hypothetical protein
MQVIAEPSLCQYSITKDNHKIWENPPHTFERQPGKKKGANDYNSNHAYLVKKLGR